MSENHIHDSMESALAAVRRSIAAGEERSAKERVAHDQQLLMERDVEALEAPPRTRPRRGKDRSAYDAKRHNWKLQVQNKVIDEEGDDYSRHLHEAYEALLNGDRGGFCRSVERAIHERVRDVLEGMRLELIDELCARRNEED